MSGKHNVVPVKCPNLNNKWGHGWTEYPSLDVLVQFTEGVSQPTGLMCPQYDQDQGKCVLTYPREDKKEDCIYREWKPFK